MKRYLIALLGVILLFSSCFEDKGNYDYVEINEITLGSLKDSYSIFADVGILNIDPVVHMTMADPSDERFEYYWIVVNSKNEMDTISRERILNWQANLTIGNYTLRFRVHDKLTGISKQAMPESTTANTVGLNILVYHSRGLLLYGENSDGYAQAQLIAMMPGQDEIFYDDILQYSDLPQLRGPINFFHTGNNTPITARELWVVTESGSYFLHRNTLKMESDFCMLNHKLYFPIAENLYPIEVVPIIRANNGATGSDGNRYIRCSNGGIYGAWISYAGDMYDQPINNVDGTGNFGRAKGEMLFTLTSSASYLWYDQDHEYFVKMGSPMLPNPTKLTDAGGDVFPWNQSGRTYVYGENTHNIDGGSTNGNSFAIMHETAGNVAGNYDYCIYKLYCASTPAKRAFYPVDRTAAPNFGSASMYAFSSYRTAVFYIFNGKLYAYDYDTSVKRNYEVSLADDNEVTMIRFDVQREPKSDYLYVATYSASSGGTLYKYAIDANLNLIKLENEPLEKWTGLVKIKSVSWRGGE